MKLENCKIAVIGLGYVGLPLARLLATKYHVIGFDINIKRIEELNKGHDSTLEVKHSLLTSVLIKDKKNEIGLYCTNKLTDMEYCNYYIVTVPTPVDKYNKPDLTPLYKASETVGRILKKGDIVIYESTVYPGVTEEECVPVIEKISGLKYNIDFFAGYSPERINPGDKEHTVDKIVKVTSGSTNEVGEKVDALYKSVITAGTHLAPNIKTAEASKVIENAQRDINIAFVNELAKIFKLIGINTHDVLAAAGTKWNFLPFTPGLVGGHCIGVDPYYLAQKSLELGYHPEIILGGRRINDNMGDYVAKQVIDLMIKKEINILNSQALILGITFKENCPDIRNTKVVDIIKTLERYGVKVSIYDPWADKLEVENEYQFSITNTLPKNKFDSVIVCVAHKEFNDIDYQNLLNKNSVLYDIKGILTNYIVDGKL
jgi:UDP-N-acetyl-D-galactosamine dehydrogenase